MNGGCGCLTPLSQGSVGGRTGLSIEFFCGKVDSLPIQRVLGGISAERAPAEAELPRSAPSDAHRSQLRMEGEPRMIGGNNCSAQFFRQDPHQKGSV